MSVRGAGRFGRAALSVFLLLGRAVEEGLFSELEARFRSSLLFWLPRRFDITLLILESIIVSALYFIGVSAV